MRLTPDSAADVGLLVASALAPGTFASSLSTSRRRGSGNRHGLVYRTALPADRKHAGHLAGHRRRALGRRCGRRGSDSGATACVHNADRRCRGDPDRSGGPACAAPASRRGDGPGVAAAGRLEVRGDRPGRRCAGRRPGGCPVVGCPHRCRWADRRAPGGRAGGSRRRVPAGTPPGAGVGRESSPVRPTVGAAIAGRGRRGRRRCGTAAAYVEHLLADQLARRAAGMLPGPVAAWRVMGHGAFLVALAAGVSALWHRTMRRIEAGTSADQPVYRAR